MSNKLAGKTIAIIVAQEYEDIELLYPILRLSEEGATVLVAAVPIGTHPRPWLPDKPVTGRFGHPVPNPVMPPGPRYRMVTVEELSADHVDCLLFPGGFAPDTLRRHDPTLALTRACHQAGKILAAICHGPWVLISAGAVRGRKATCVRAVRDDLINAGAEYLDVPAVRDGNIITGRAPNDLPEFCGEIISALAG